MATAGLFAVGISSDSKGLSGGFGSVDQDSIIRINDKTDYDSPGRIIGIIVLANLPQLILSALYFAYNSMYICMLAASEWSRFAQHKKALRVTSPTHVQRSTYWLQLPYTYGLPLTFASSLMHWLVSQCFFLARIDAYDSLGQIDRDRSISSCGYSNLATFIAMFLGTGMIIALLITGQRRLDPQIPLVGSCSLAISAACHRPDGDTDAAFKPLKWGAIRHETESGPGHCCFITYKVEQPIFGHHYAGF